MIRPAFFIAGTDTGCGKTTFSCTLLKTINTQGRTAVGMKPIACGAKLTDQGWHNDDAELLLINSCPTPQYHDINPYVFELPASPHFASGACEIDLVIIEQAYQRLVTSADHVVVEGIGGWQVPLAQDLWMPDLVKRLDLPVILVISIKLGCINHAMLTVKAILASGCKVYAWVANKMDPAFPYAKESIEFLQAEIKAPLIVEFEYLTNGESSRVNQELWANIKQLD